MRAALKLRQLIPRDFRPPGASQSVNQNTSTPDSSVPELLRCFEQELPQAPDAGAVLERYASLHPELASTLRELAEAIEMLRHDSARPRNRRERPKMSSISVAVLRAHDLPATCGQQRSPYVDVDRILVAVHTPNNLYSRFVLLHMSQQLPLLEPLWSRVPADLQVTLLDGWKSLHDRIAELEATVRDLQARLQLNSTNSSKPPSSDPIGLKRKPPTPPSRRRRGGQPGHRKAFRALVPPEKLRSSTDCKPDACRRCGHALSRGGPRPPDPSGRRVAPDRADRQRIPPASPGLPRLRSDHLRSVARGRPHGPLRPLLAGHTGHFGRHYRLSKRPIQQLAGDLFGLSISTGMISKLERLSAEAFQAPYNELATAVHTAGVIGADETGWREDRHKAWLWAAVTALFTVFTIARNRNARVARAVLGTQDGPIAVTDRWSAYDWIAGASRPGLLESSPPRFPGDDRPRRRRRADREEAVALLGPAVPLVASPRGQASGLGAIPHGDGPVEARVQDGPGGRGALRTAPRTRGTCAELLRVEESLWTFARVAGVPPTNNAAEHARAARGDLASDQRGNRQRGGEPVRGADADGGGHLPPAGAERAGLPDILFRGGSR